MVEEIVENVVVSEDSYIDPIEVRLHLPNEIVDVLTLMADERELEVGELIEMWIIDNTTHFKKGV